MGLTVISPHLDDAVFSCGGLIAANAPARVITVFAGVPSPNLPVPEWDAACGFRSASQAMHARRAEDRAALHILGAEPCWLDYLDAQYGPSPSTDEVADGLRPCIDGGITAFPLGLFHSDHALVHRAALRLARERPGTSWVLYADALYRSIPGLVTTRLEALAAAGASVSSFTSMPDANQDKARAVACYTSQLRGLATPGRPGHADALGPERYWRIEP